MRGLKRLACLIRMSSIPLRGSFPMSFCMYNDPFSKDWSTKAAKETFAIGLQMQDMGLNAGLTTE